MNRWKELRVRDVIVPEVITFAVLPIKQYQSDLLLNVEPVSLGN